MIRNADGLMDRKKDRRPAFPTDGRNRQADRQADRKTYRQTDRQVADALIFELVLIS